MPSLGVLCLLWGGSMCMNLVVMIGFTFKNLEHLEDKLHECTCIADTRSIWQGGVIGRHMRFNMIFMIMYIPEIMYRKGYATQNAYLKIPRHLRRMIWGIYAWLLANGVAMGAPCYLISGSSSALS